MSDEAFTWKTETNGLSAIPADDLQQELLYRAINREALKIAQHEYHLLRMKEKQAARFIELGRIVQRRKGGER